MKLSVAVFNDNFCKLQRSELCQILVVYVLKVETTKINVVEAKVGILQSTMKAAF
jgi:hypothetical protein